MWRPSINFITLHYAYITFAGILVLITLYPYGNMRAVDAYFFGVSSSTESGLNTIDLKELALYQQLVLYFVPMLTNIMFINGVVVVVRLVWFRRRMREYASTRLRSRAMRPVAPYRSLEMRELPGPVEEDVNAWRSRIKRVDTLDDDENVNNKHAQEARLDPSEEATSSKQKYDIAARTITFADDAAPPFQMPKKDKTLYVPSPRERDKGQLIREIDSTHRDDQVDSATTGSARHGRVRWRARSLANSISVERAASALFVVGAGSSEERSHSRDPSTSRPNVDFGKSLPRLSVHATIGRNSNFENLTVQDREALGGIEYRALKLLLKVIIAYFIGLHLFGAICLTGWIQTAPARYQDYLAGLKIDITWWGFYTGQSMVDNLGFTLTPDSMIHFQDSIFPLLVMTFLALFGNTFYPIGLRLVIWTMTKIMPKGSSVQNSLNFLLEHPRRCYTLLFPGKMTWMLFVILILMNFVDVFVIIIVDLHNAEVSKIPVGHRILAALFQAASTRHSGTATFNLAEISPAAQFSFVIMMYIAVFPIALSIRASNTYEEKSLGLYQEEKHPADENNPRSYLRTHIYNQLSFDIWYVFLGNFCICIAEADRIMNVEDPAFQVFSIFFEVVSAYSNVGLSLGYPTVTTSLTSRFNTFSKLVICAMMIRGRHRGLPYQIDRSIKLPDDGLFERNDEENR